MLPDHEAARIAASLATADAETLRRWVRLLLDDRRGRSGLLLGQARRLAYTRKRLRQAFHYLDGLFVQAEEETKAAWPTKTACPRCGAPTTGAKAEQRAQGHELVREHPDGVRCGESERR